MIATVFNLRKTIHFDWSVQSITSFLSHVNEMMLNCKNNFGALLRYKNVIISLVFARSKDDKPVAKDFYKLHQLGDKYSLSISDVLPEDTGFYTCTASNPAGRAERTIKLKVRGRGLIQDLPFGCLVGLVFIGDLLFLTLCFHLLLFHVGYRHHTSFHE